MSGRRVAAVAALAGAAVLISCTAVQQTPNALPPPSGTSAYPSVAAPAVQLYPVQGVHDGDTLRVREADGQSASVRVLGINAPEIAAPPGTPADTSASTPEDLGRYPECGAVEARDAARALLLGKSVQLTADPEQGDKDRYGRLLRYVSLPDGRDLAAELLRSGLVQVYTAFPVSRTPDYLRIQRSAQDAELGGWATCGWSQ